MSLKAFHIFFIAVSVLMSFGIGAFRGAAYMETGETAAAAQSAACFAAGIGLTYYGWRFLKKYKQLGYL